MDEALLGMGLLVVPPTLVPRLEAEGFVEGRDFVVSQPVPESESVVPRASVQEVRKL